MWDQSLPELFLRGGPVMWPLLGLSILGLALILDRAVAYLWLHQSFDRSVAGVRKAIQEDNNAWLTRWTQRRGAFSRVVGVYLEQRAQPKEAREDVLRREGQLFLDCLERRLRWLGVISQIATLLGLLGTVTGLVDSFHRVELLGGQVQPSDLASGIWEALLTTVFGLVIAIPCMVAHHAFDSRVEATAKQMGMFVSYLDEWSKARSVNGASLAPLLRG